MESLAALLPALLFLASTGGAGLAGARLFSALRRALPPPAGAAWAALAPWQRLGYALLYERAAARCTVFLLTAAVAIAASGAVALISGRPVAPALDASAAIILGQIVHALGLAE